MKSYVLLAAAVLVSAQPKDLPWHPPGFGDERSPCPMLNALANHEILPHDGKNIDRDMIIDTFTSVLNLNESFAEDFFQLGIETTLNPNATTFSLHDTNRHDIVEIDASLSRADFFFGDNHSFNLSVWAQSKYYWTGPIIDIPSAAATVASRVRMSRATNPTFSREGDLSSTTIAIGLIMTVLGDHVSGTAKKQFIEELFEGERLPVAQGWVKSAEVINKDFADDLAARIFNASGLAPLEPLPASKMLKRRGFVHPGL